MSDPATEAAERYDETLHVNHQYYSGDLIRSAREALRPVREWFSNPDRTLQSLAPLIFTTEEIESWRLNQHVKS